MTIGQLAAIRARIAGRLEPHTDVTEIAMAVADLRSLLDEVDRLHIERDSAYRRGVEQAIRSVEGEATASALRQAERLRSMLLDDGACRDLVLEIKCKQSFRRGVEAMREAAAQALSTQGNGYYGLTGSGVAKTIRALPIPEDKS
jgi:hypothetical protein